jgi:CheY-like chemotaxis protein
MPRKDGLAVAAELSKSKARSKILVLTMHDSRELATAVQKAGASGYVIKTQAARDLLRAAEAILAGGTFFSVEPQLASERSVDRTYTRSYCNFCSRARSFCARFSSDSDQSSRAFTCRSFFQVIAQFHQLVNIRPNAVLGFPREGRFFLQEGRVEPKVEQHMALLLIDAILEFEAMRDKSNAGGTFDPYAIFSALPQIPIAFKDIRVVRMEELRGKQDGLFRPRARIEAALPNRGLLPRNWVQAHVHDAGTLRRKTKLAQHAEGVRQHFVVLETCKPETQENWVSHLLLVYRAAALAPSARNSAALCSSDKSSARAAESTFAFENALFNGADG